MFEQPTHFKLPERKVLAKVPNKQVQNVMSLTISLSTQSDLKQFLKIQIFLNSVASDNCYKTLNNNSILDKEKKVELAINK